jgi:hypothetical protein
VSNRLLKHGHAASKIHDGFTPGHFQFRSIDTKVANAPYRVRRFVLVPQRSHSGRLFAPDLDRAEAVDLVAKVRDGEPWYSCISREKASRSRNRAQKR